MSERSAPRFLLDLGGRGGGATFLGGGARGVVGGAPGVVGGGPVGGGGAVKLTNWLVGLGSLRSALGGLRGVTGYLYRQQEINLGNHCYSNRLLFLSSFPGFCLQCSFLLFFCIARNKKLAGRRPVNKVSYFLLCDIWGLLARIC